MAMRDVIKLDVSYHRVCSDTGHELYVGDIVKHFKHETLGKDDDKLCYLYQIIACGRDESSIGSHLRYVVYRSLYDGMTYVREYFEFISEVDHVSYPEIKQKYRFEKV